MATLLNGSNVAILSALQSIIQKCSAITALQARYLGTRAAEFVALRQLLYL